MNGLTFSQKYWESDFYCCCSSVAQLCLTLCDLMDCITLGLPLILFSFCPLFFPSIRDFSNESFASDDQNTGVSASHQSFQWIFSIDIPYDWLVWSPCSPRNFQESSPEPEFEGINSSVLCILYGPTLTTVRNHWEDHSLDLYGRLLAG